MASFDRHISRKHLSGIQTLMLHALGFVTGDHTIRIGYPYGFHRGLQVTVNEAGDAKWIYMMLPVTRGSLITDIKLTHLRSSRQSHIAIIRLLEQRTPVSATVVHNEIFGKTTPLSCTVASACHVVVNHSLLLKVCMDFADTDDMIELGSVEVCYIPGYASLPKHRKIEAKKEKHVEKSIAGKISIGHFHSIQRLSLHDLITGKKKEKTYFFNIENIK